MLAPAVLALLLVILIGAFMARGERVESVEQADPSGPRYDPADARAPPRTWWPGRPRKPG